MRIWVACVLAIGVALLFSALLLQSASVQGTSMALDVHTIESATVINGGICSNSAIGVSYKLPEGMKPEDAAEMREYEVAGSGLAPEARYFLYGYQEATTAILLCGGSSREGTVMMIATPASALQSLGPHALEQLVQGMGQEPGSPPSSPSRQTINGIEFERADAQTKMNSPGRRTVEVHESFFAAQVNSYAVMWSLTGHSEEEWKRLVGGMDSVKIFASAPVTASPRPTAGTTKAGSTPIALDFQARLDAFLKSWLADRDSAKTLAFVDSAAYAAPPLIGTYCDGWYHKSDPPQRVAQIVASNLMGVPSEFPKGTQPATIFGAWNRFPPEWVTASANNVAADHYLVAGLDRDSMGRIFSGVYAKSDYDAFLEGEIRKAGSAYWVVFPELAPDGDVFVIFTLWQKSNANWNIVHIDSVCQ
ncbi:MAG: hypothetical protein WA175_03920 [Candidatus Acidiferrales bacterium]